MQRLLALSALGLFLWGPAFAETPPPPPRLFLPDLGEQISDLLDSQIEEQPCRPDLGRQDSNLLIIEEGESTVEHPNECAEEVYWDAVIEDCEAEGATE